MNITLLLIIEAVSVWLALMTLAVTLPFRPQVLHMTKKWVCPPGCEMRIRTNTASYHRPGEKGLSIECIYPAALSSVTCGKLLAAFRKTSF
jgi:hypothetical protein